MAQRDRPVVGRVSFASGEQMEYTDVEAYESPALGVCYMHQMRYDFGGTNVMGFCSEKGKGMGWSLEGHKWDKPQPISDPTVQNMMAYFYCHKAASHQ